LYFLMFIGNLQAIILYQITSKSNFLWEII